MKKPLSGQPFGEYFEERFVPLSQELIQHCRQQFADTVVGSYTILENLGNTCYLNSFVMTLLMTRDFRKLILESEIPQDPLALVNESYSQELSALQ